MTSSAEVARVAALRDLRIVNSGPEPEYDRLVRIAGQIAKASEAHMCFIDDHYQYIKAIQGASFDRKQAREQSICEAVVSQGAPVLIPDLAADPLPKRRAVAEQFGFRSYVGMPIILPEGHTVGVVATMSETVGICSQRRLDALQDLAAIATRELVMRRLTGTRAGLFAPVAAPHLVAVAAIPDSHAKVLQAITDGILGFRADGTINFANPAAERLLGRSADSMLGMTFAGALRAPEPDGRDRNCPVATCIQNGTERFVPSARFLHSSGASVQVEFVVSPLQSNGRTTGAIVIFRDTGGVALSNGVELRKSLREVARLKEQIARLEAYARSTQSPAVALPAIDGSDRPSFAQLAADLESEKADQIRRVTALLESWADRPRLAGMRPDGADLPSKAVEVGMPLDDKKLSRIERWLADQVSKERGNAASLQQVPPLGGSGRPPGSGRR